MSEPRKPQDRKKKAEPKDIPATFTYAIGDEEITLPSLDSLMTMGTVRKTRHLTNSDAMFFVLEENADDETLALLDGMRVEQMEDFFKAWQEHSDLDVGESKASSSS